MNDTVAHRLQRIRHRIQEACEVSGRSSDEIVLVGACKRQPLDRLRTAHAAGLRDFGENLVQEALEHRAELPPEINWHFIGPLQSNKANKAVTTFRWIHSIDRAKIAATLERAAERQNIRLHGLLEINLGNEPSKHGFDPRSLSPQVAEFADFRYLRIEGLMAIPPFETEPERSRSWFRRLREVRDKLFSEAAWSDRPGYLS
ncbi:MAG: YggS family pyridoxal phosphate-dependent enzyme, partial [Acidobacteriota bacterium]|nr:YggS family pyridoxal phosphate-dependent enzyme [Acidobacteriota bacterium]